VQQAAEAEQRRGGVDGAAGLGDEGDVGNAEVREEGGEELCDILAWGGKGVAVRL